MKNPDVFREDFEVCFMKAFSRHWTDWKQEQRLRGEHLISTPNVRLNTLFLFLHCHISQARRRVSLDKKWQSHLITKMRSEIQLMILEEKAGDENVMRILSERFPGHHDSSQDVPME